MGFLRRLFDPSKKTFKKAKKVALEVLKLEDSVKKLNDDDFKIETQKLKDDVANGKDLNQIMPYAFALVREASRRVTGMFPFFVQVIGAYVIHDGNIAEMKTGEGKTLTAVMPAYLNALKGEGVHIVTVNEYLAKREAEGEIGNIFRFLGLSVGLNLRDLSSDEKRAAYDCDILYTTNSELGFDYLRDHMVLYKDELVQRRGLPYAIIDEVDSILIDEARTPLIISGGIKNTAQLYEQADRFAKSLDDDEYELDIEDQTIELLPKGVEKAERIFNLNNLYDLDNVNLVHHINNAMKANFIMKRGKEYEVVNDEVLIVDQFTGRILKGRQFSEGLHQALEAKEHVIIKKETQTVAEITYQNFFRMYKKLSGMTGTAKTEEDEFRDIYNMNVVVIPTNMPMIRFDDNDSLYASEEAKFKGLIEEVKKRHALGQPILIGTISVETSEVLSILLQKEHLPHEVLNAKNHEREAEIIKNAGQLGAITIATNMAGRGTDIKLGEGVVKLGGLAVLGSERHESRRIDNQLRGRSGRQGDPGYSKFFISADDELLVRFGGERFKERLKWIHSFGGFAEDEPITFKMFTKFVTNAQKKIEGVNFDTRKHILKYDDITRQQREIIYGERMKVIKEEIKDDEILQMINKGILYHYNRISFSNDKEIAEQVFKAFDKDLFREGDISIDKIKEKNSENEIIDYLKQLANDKVREKKDNVPAEIFSEFLRVVLLRVIDTHWMEQIDTMSELRQSANLQSYAQTDPFILYQQRGKQLFKELLENIAIDTTRYIIRAVIDYNVERENVVKNTQTNQGEDAEIKNKRPKAKKSKNPWDKKRRH